MLGASYWKSIKKLPEKMCNKSRKNCINIEMWLKPIILPTKLNNVSIGTKTQGSKRDIFFTTL